MAEIMDRSDDHSGNVIALVGYQPGTNELWPRRPHNFRPPLHGDPESVYNMPGWGITTKLPWKEPVGASAEARAVNVNSEEMEFDNLLEEIKTRETKRKREEEERNENYDQQQSSRIEELPNGQPQKRRKLSEEPPPNQMEKFSSGIIIDPDFTMIDGYPAGRLAGTNFLPLVFETNQQEGGTTLAYKKLQELSESLAVFNPRDELQIQAQVKFTLCAMRHIFGDVFDALRERIAREFGVNRLRSGTIVYMPRRHGKTFAVAQFAAAYAVMLTKYCSFVVELIAHGIKQTSMLMGFIKDHIDKLKPVYTDFSYGRDNAFELWVCRNGHVSKIRCWTDSLAHTLGLGGNGIIILDEAVQMSMKFFIKNIKPILQMANNSIAICSSPGDQDNWVTRLMNVKDEDNVPVLDVLNQVFVCKNCEKLPFEKMIDCEHVRPPPFWLSAEKKAINKVIAKAFNAIGTHLTEEQGMVAGYCESPAFNSADLAAAFEVPFKSHQYSLQPSVLYISIDVGCGKSRTAVISGYVDGDKVVIVSIDGVHSDDTGNVREFYRNLVTNLRKISYLRNIPYVLIVEQDFANSTQITTDLTVNSGLQGLYFFREDVCKKESKGIFKRGKSGIYVSVTGNLVKNRRIVFDPNLFTLTLGCEAEHHTKTDDDKKLSNPDANNAIHYLLYEMLRCGWDEQKHKYHGKWNNQNDDTAIALQMLCFWMDMIYKGNSSHYPQIKLFMNTFVPPSDELDTVSHHSTDNRW